MRRPVNVYVDGFNFYYAVRERAEREGSAFPIGLGWCDFRKLTERHLLAAAPGGRAAYEVKTINYFTAKVERGDAIRDGEDRRQPVWLDAVRTIPDVKVFESFHQRHEADAPARKRREEKQTDVKIAVELLVDAVTRACDYAVLITGDIDQAPAVHAVRERLPAGQRLEVDVWVPPGVEYERWKVEAGELGMNCREITREMLVTSRLPDEIPLASGGTLTCPGPWRVPPNASGPARALDARTRRS